MSPTEFLPTPIPHQLKHVRHPVKSKPDHHTPMITKIVLLPQELHHDDPPKLHHESHHVPKPSIIYEIPQPPTIHHHKAPHPTPSSHQEISHVLHPTPKPQFHHHSTPQPHIVQSSPVKFTLVSRSDHPDSMIPVTIAPSLYVPKQFVAERRYIEDEEKPVRMKPTPFDRIQQVTPRSVINSVTTSAPFHIKTTQKPFYHSTTTPSINFSTTPRIHSSVTPTIQYSTTPISSFSYSTPSSNVVMHSAHEDSGRNLPPIQNHPNPLVVHKAEPTQYQYQPSQHSETGQNHQHYLTDEDEEPPFLLQVVPNPNYSGNQQSLPRKPKAIARRSDGNLNFDVASSSDPNLYPLLYVLSSYLPQSEHSLVVAKRS